MKITVEQVAQETEEEVVVRCHDPEAAWIGNVREAASGQRWVCGYLDGSLRRHDRVYPAAGDGHTAVDLTVEELEYAADPLGWVDVTKDPAAE